MATSQRPKSASTNKQGGRRTVATAVKRFLRELERAPLAQRTKDAYSQHVAAYGAWLAGRRDSAKALADPKARDYAARDFKRHLKVDRGWKPASVNLALAAVDHFNRFLGLGPAKSARGVCVQKIWRSRGIWGLSVPRLCAATALMVVVTLLCAAPGQASGATFSGVLVDASGNPVTSGYVWLIDPSTGTSAMTLWHRCRRAVSREGLSP